jgi:hypothetical protein
MHFMKRRLPTGLLIGLLFYLTLPSASFAVPEQITKDIGGKEVFARGGPVKPDREVTWTIDAGFRVGLPLNLEAALPLALTWAIVRDSRFQISLTGGITDFWPIDRRNYLYTPAMVVATLAQLSHEAVVFFSLDYTHVQENFRRSPGFIRGAGALMVDMGPYLTWCVGISYQHVAVDRTSPRELDRSGLAGRHRVSVGSVRAAPFADLPLFSLHTGTRMDITINGRLDINANAESTDARLEGGLLYSW